MTQHPTPNTQHPTPNTQHPTPRLWGGRFEGGTDELVDRLNRSLGFDCRLWSYDVAGSIAHATMLGETGIIPTEDAATIVEGLREIESGLDSGALALDPQAEDVHSAVEALLRERIGPVAGKLHTARSRNDQVATDTRLYLRDAIDRIRDELAAFQSTLLTLADEHLGAEPTNPQFPISDDQGPITDSGTIQNPKSKIHNPTILPGFTHLQHAQPILLSHYLLAYFWMLQRDRERLGQIRVRVNALPLGAGALAGTSFPIRRERVAELLRFDSVIENSLDAVSDRDFVIEFLAAASLLMMHCSRLAEEIILWNSPEFGFVELDDRYTTGSSIMPQKKNPDVAELARGKTGRVYGALMSVLTMMKGLPLAYNKDMQEDKEPLFDAVDTLLTLLPPFRLMLATAQFNAERMAKACHNDFSTATDLADLLVRQGIPFREAHHLVGRIVKTCVERGEGLEELDEERLEQLIPGLGRAAHEAVSVRSSIEARTARGGTASAAVRDQLESARRCLADS